MAYLPRKSWQPPCDASSSALYLCVQRFVRSERAVSVGEKRKILPDWPAICLGEGRKEEGAIKRSERNNLLTLEVYRVEGEAKSAYSADDRNFHLRQIMFFCGATYGGRCLFIVTYSENLIKHIYV